VKKNEDGEVELILGNGQLLGVFFIVVILLGLFFGMGYIMGRSSGAASVEVAAVPKAEPNSVAVEPAAGKAAAPEANAPAAPPPGEPREAEPKQATPKEAAKPEATDAGQARSRPGPAAAESPSGVYLQLAATTKHEAELEVDVLRRKNFRALTMEVPEKPGTFRVLVGPVADGGINKARDDLQDAGFPGKSAILRRF
jgi:type IV secretory pathway VirB10-like protein